ncbi:grifin [Tiliqua scincoides]|uniref:grifin n=1 Tax=Tiliqua scincoides TaxID=71010 RepID=UPI003462E55D
MVLRFEATYPKGLCPGWSVIVKGETGSSTNTFEINFLDESGEQIAFHFNPRLADSVIVCNSFLSNHWGQEEVTETVPLEAKEPFQVEIYSDQDFFHVFVDETKVLQYKHRLKYLPTVSRLQIMDDIHISSVEVTRRGLC